MEGEIAAMLVAMLAARKVRQRAVQRLVREREFGLLEGQRLNVVAVVVKRFGVGGSGATPLGISLDERQAQRQGAEKWPVDDEPGARGGEFGFDAVIHRNRWIHRINRIFQD